MVFRFKKQNSALSGSQPPCMLTLIHWFHLLWSKETSDTTSGDIKRWSVFTPRGTWSFFSFDLAKTSDEHAQCRLMTRRPWLNCRRSMREHRSNKSTITGLLSIFEEAKNAWTAGQINDVEQLWQAKDRRRRQIPFIFCCLTERQNFLAVALFPSLTLEILPLSWIITKEIMSPAAKFPTCRIS